MEGRSASKVEGKCVHLDGGHALQGGEHAISRAGGLQDRIYDRHGLSVSVHDGTHGAGHGLGTREFI